MLVTSADERKASGSRSAAAGSRGVDAALALETGAVERNLARIFHTKSKVLGSSVPFTQVWTAWTGRGGLRGKGCGCCQGAVMPHINLNVASLSCHSHKCGQHGRKRGCGVALGLLQSAAAESGWRVAYAWYSCTTPWPQQLEQTVSNPVPA